MSSIPFILVLPFLVLLAIADEEVTKDVENVGSSCWVHISPGCIRGQNMKRYRKKSVEQCKLLCLNNTDCAAFEYGVKHTGKSRVYKAGDCQLNRAVDKRKCSGRAHDLDLYIYQKECLEGLHPGISQGCVALQVVGLLVFFAVFLRIITGRQCAKSRCCCCRKKVPDEETEYSNNEDSNSTKELVCGTNNYALGDDFCVHLNNDEEKSIVKGEIADDEEDEDLDKMSILTV